MKFRRVSSFGFRAPSSEDSEIVGGFGGFGFRASGLGFGVSGFGSQVPGLGFQLSCFRFKVPAFEFRASGSGFQVLGSGFRVPGSGVCISSFVLRISDFDCRVGMHMAAGKFQGVMSAAGPTGCFITRMRFACVWALGFGGWLGLI